MVRCLIRGLVFLLISGSCYAQSGTDTLLQPDPYIFETPETLPEFPGGERKMYCFLDKQLNKPLLLKADTSGLLVARFTIDTTGRVTDIKIVKPLNRIAEQEFMRVLGLMPKWSPGKIGDKPVKVVYNLPLRLPYENRFCL